MNTTTNTPDFFERVLQDTVAANYWHNTPPILHVALIGALALVVHFVVKIVHWTSEWVINKRHVKQNPFGFVTETPKFITLTHLIVSAVTFAIYFVAVGLVMIAVFHLSDTFLKTYLSSAAVVGLALSFGLQGLVQDVVTGVTLILSSAIDVGDVVDLSGTIGRVEQDWAAVHEGD